ncbi:outer membrane homotrimeric porin [Halodesulfovibrio aestuarii]|uniref:Outer membrane homotrimeric porin n=1 Tax=Halodesulfovibrio aestuarii TaxID=126333 RepID=A0ABV4JWW2_9BACT
MKKHPISYVIKLCIITASLLCIADTCVALEIHPSGTLQVFTQWSTGSTLGFASPYAEKEINNDFRAAQYYRFQFDINPHEEVSGTALFEVDTYWGVDEGNGYGEFAGGQIGTDGANIQTTFMFIHVKPDQLPLDGRAGLISASLPNQIGGSIILDDNIAAVTLGYEFTDTINGTVIWGRPYTNSDPAFSNETMDIFAATFSYTPKDNIFTPYVAYTEFGKNVSGDPLGIAWVDGGNIGLWNGFSNFSGNPWAFWAGFSGRYHSPCNLIAKSDLMWGTLYGGNDAASRQGAVLLGELDWALNFMTIGILGWWGSGDSNNAYEDGAGRMPFITNQWGLTDFGYYKYAITTESALLIQDATGRWTLGITVDDLAFTDDLSTSCKLLYMRGTNNTDAVKNNRFSPELLQGGYRNNWGTYLTTKDWLIEIDSETTLKVYEHLSLILRLGYIHIEVDPQVWGTSNTRDAYRAVLLWDYQF